MSKAQAKQTAAAQGEPQAATDTTALTAAEVPAHNHNAPSEPTKASAPAAAPPAPAPVAAAPVKAGPPRKLPPRNLAESSFDRNVWSITPEVGTKMEDILKPEYFAHVGAKFKPRDIIEVCFPDMTYFATLIVVDTDRLWTKTAVLFEKDLTGEKERAAEARATLSPLEYESKYVNITDKWAVFRMSDNVKISTGHGTKQDAEKWIGEHLKAMAR